MDSVKAFEIRPGGEFVNRRPGDDGEAFVIAHRIAAQLAANRKRLYQVFHEGKTEPLDFGSSFAPALLQAQQGIAAYFEFSVKGWLPMPEEKIEIEREVSVDA